MTRHALPTTVALLSFLIAAPVAWSGRPGAARAEDPTIVKKGRSAASVKRLNRASSLLRSTPGREEQAAPYGRAMVERIERELAVDRARVAQLTELVQASDGYARDRARAQGEAAAMARLDPRRAVVSLRLRGADRAARKATRDLDVTALARSLAADNVRAIEASIAKIDLERATFTSYIRQLDAEPAAGVGNFGVANAYELELELAGAHVRSARMRLDLLRQLSATVPSSVDRAQADRLARTLDASAARIRGAVIRIEQGPMGRYVRRGGADRDFRRWGGTGERRSFFE